MVGANFWAGGVGGPKKSVAELLLSLSDLVGHEVEKSAVIESHCYSSDALFEESQRWERRQEKHGRGVQFLEMQRHCTIDCY